MPPGQELRNGIRSGIQSLPMRQMWGRKYCGGVCCVSARNANVFGRLQLRSEPISRGGGRGSSKSAELQTVFSDLGDSDLFCIFLGLRRSEQDGRPSQFSVSRERCRGFLVCWHTVRYRSATKCSPGCPLQSRSVPATSSELGTYLYLQTLWSIDGDLVVITLTHKTDEKSSAR